MTEQKDNSSLPLFLVLTTVVVVIVAGGWFLLDQQETTPSEPGDVSEVTAETPPQASAVAEIAAMDKPKTDLEAELRKARLAADADILAFPANQSALHFYGRVLSAEPHHAVAKAEFDAVLARIALQVAELLAARNYDSAFRIASLVAKQEPGHQLVQDVQQNLNDSAGALVEQAIQHAQSGNDADAESALAAAAALPGRNPEYFSALRDSITEIQQSRIATEQNQLQEAQQAAANAEAAWLAQFRNAIASGRLISPPGDNARDYLSAEEVPEGQIDQLKSELVAAIIDSCQDNIELNRLSEAEALLTAANELDEDEARVAELQASVETAFVEAEENRIRTLNELVRRKTVPARYPQRAQRLGYSGWVEVVFTVTPTGETADIEVSQAEPESMFNRSAIDAVSQWTFVPLEFRGQLISQRAIARLAFQLE